MRAHQDFPGSCGSSLACVTFGATTGGNAPGVLVRSVGSTGDDFPGNVCAGEAPAHLCALFGTLGTLERWHEELWAQGSGASEPQQCQGRQEAQRNVPAGILEGLRRRGQGLPEQEMPPELGVGQTRAQQCTRALRMPQHGSRLAPSLLCRKEAD